MRYKVGDVVLIKDDLKVGAYYSKQSRGKRLHFVSEMEIFCGRIAKVTEVLAETSIAPERYRLSFNDGWLWSSEMLIPFGNTIAYYLYEREET